MTSERTSSIKGRSNYLRRKTTVIPHSIFQVRKSFSNPNNIFRKIKKNKA
jgi:hypothetical protein